MTNLTICKSISQLRFPAAALIFDNRGQIATEWQHKQGLSEWRITQNNVVARQPELEVFGEGEDEIAAIQALRYDIIRLYEDLIDIEPCELGPLPRSWQRILKKIMTRA